MRDYVNYQSNMMERFNSLQPVEVRGKYNANNFYQKRYLLQKIYSKFEFTLPEEFDLNTFRFVLFMFGNFAIFKKKDTVFFSMYAVEEWNIYYNPYKISSRLFTEDAVVNTKLGVRNAIVDEDAVIIKCFDDYFGFADLLNDYAETLASFDKAIKTALMNANVNLLAFAKDEKEAAKIRLAYSRATEGEPLVIVDSDLMPEEKEAMLTAFTNHDTVGLLDKLYTARRACVNNFLTEIGINNANLNKKAHLLEDEVDANDEEVSSTIEIVYKNIKAGFDKANEIFGLNMNVTLKETKQENNDTEIENDEKEDNEDV